MAQPILLTYNLKPDTIARLRGICALQGIRIREVTTGEYVLPLGALAGIPVAGGAPHGTSAAFTDEMLVMCHMLSNQLDDFLKAMRGSGVPSIPLKAVLTPTNITWNSAALHDELSREHAAMQRRKG